MVMPITTNRYLTCPSCSHATTVATAFNTPSYMFECRNFSYTALCPKCSYGGIWLYEDRPAINKLNIPSTIVNTRVVKRTDMVRTIGGITHTFTVTTAQDTDSINQIDYLVSRRKRTHIVATNFARFSTEAEALCVHDAYVAAAAYYGDFVTTDQLEETIQARKRRKLFV